MNADTAGWIGFRQELRQGQVSPHALLREHPARGRCVIEVLLIFLCGTQQQNACQPLQLANEIVYRHLPDRLTTVDALTEDQTDAITSDLMYIAVKQRLPAPLPV